MKKIEKYDIHTEKGLGFELEISEEVDQGEFIGTFFSYSPISMPEKKPGEPLSELKVGDTHELINKDKNELIERCKEQIAKSSGRIIMFKKVSE